VKAIAKRLRRLEDQFGPADGKPRLTLVVCPAGWTMALDTDRCVEILGECGFVRTGPGMLLLDFLHVPHGLSARALEGYLREHGGEICNPRQRPVGSRAVGTI
jgi:hypothetical protein